MEDIQTTIGSLLTHAFDVNGWLGGPVPDFDISHPKDETHGDYTTNAALILGKKLGQNPRDIAQKVVTILQNDIQKDSSIEKIEIAGPGFINFYLSEKWLTSVLQNVTEEYGRNESLAGKKVMVEFTDPNPFKEFHIGHLMSNTIGESIARLVEAQGAIVRRANYQGDVGLHVAKSIWGMVKLMAKENITLDILGSQSIQERQKFMGRAYAFGATAYEEDELAKAAMHDINTKIYKHNDDAINTLYQAGREWSLAYFETIYARLGTKFDEYFFESESGKVGLEVVEEGLAKGILEVGEEGAVVYKGEKDGMHTRVFRNKLGLPTYEAKDLGLAKAKYARFPYDMSYIVTANEITEYFKVVLRVMEQLYPDLRRKTVHLPHGIMKLTSGKMSSRTGKVITGESLLAELKNVVTAKMGDRDLSNKDLITDHVAVGALKYSVLKQRIGGDIVYEPEKMSNLEGDTGPYIQYTYARTQSVLSKSADRQISDSTNKLQVEEIAILRLMYRFPEVVREAGKMYAPHLIASYIYELASRYNAFYNKHKIVGGENESFRVSLTRAVGQILQNGLSLLGIAAPTEM
jgi:arginyl-tRNA synthetase